MDESNDSSLSGRCIDIHYPFDICCSILNIYNMSAIR